MFKKGLYIYIYIIYVYQPMSDQTCSSQLKRSFQKKMPLAENQEVVTWTYDSMLTFCS